MVIKEKDNEYSGRANPKSKSYNVQKGLHVKVHMQIVNGTFVYILLYIYILYVFIIISQLDFRSFSKAICSICDFIKFRNTICAH